MGLMLSSEQNIFWLCGKGSREFKTVTITHKKPVLIGNESFEQSMKRICTPFFICTDKMVSFEIEAVLLSFVRRICSITCPKMKSFQNVYGG